MRAFTLAVDLECAFKARQADFAIESYVKGDPVDFAVPCALAQTTQSLYKNPSARPGYTYHLLNKLHFCFARELMF